MIRPFYCGTQFADWIDRNCSRCAKYSFALDPATGKTRAPLDPDRVCQIEMALFCASLGNGAVTAEIAQRMGFTGARGEDLDENGHRYGWRCPELQEAA